MEFDLTKHSESFKNAFTPFEIKDKYTPNTRLET